MNASIFNTPCLFINKISLAVMETLTDSVNVKLAREG